MGVYSAESSRKQIKIARCMDGILLRLLRLLRQLLGHPQRPPTAPLASSTDKNFCHGHVRFDNLQREQKRRESGSNGKAAIETATAAAIKASQQQAPRQLCLGTYIAPILPGGRSRGHGCTGTCVFFQRGGFPCPTFLRLLNEAGHRETLGP